MSIKYYSWFFSLTAICLGISWIAVPAEEEIRFVRPEGWPAPVYDFSRNPVSEAQFRLGRILFYDPVLSRDSTISCSSCHLQFTNFTHIDHQLSHGIDGRIGNRNSLAILNVAWSKNFMWDGGVTNIEVQALAPIHNPLEMDFSIEKAVAVLKRSEKYQERFDKAFGSSTEITGEKVLKALSQFMLMLVSSNSKYDKVMRREPGIEFSSSEKNGLRLFRKNCASCHREPLFTNGGFENNGLVPDTFLRDEGRIKITQRPEDSLLFKVPTLRNIELSYPYMHDGRFRNLEMVLFHYTSGIHYSPTLSGKLKKPVKLSAAEKKDVINFLKTLTDKEFLYDKRFRYHRED